MIVGGVEIVLVLFGMKWLERFYRYTSVILIVCYLALTIYLITHYTLRYPKQTVPMNWGSALSVVLTFSLLAWTYKLSTTLRFAVSFVKRGEGFVLLGAFGRHNARGFGHGRGRHLLPAGHRQLERRPARRPHLGLGIRGRIGCGAGRPAHQRDEPVSVHRGPAGGANNVHKRMRWEQPLATVVLGLCGIGLAIAGILQHVSTLLSDAGDLIIPFTFVMLVDWIYVQRRRTAADAFFEHPTGHARRFVPSAIGAVIVGFIVGYWGNHFLPGFFYNTLPLPVVGGILAALLYGVVARIWPRPSVAAAGSHFAVAVV